MKQVKSIFSFLIVGSLLLAGCIAVDIRQANHELVNLYNAKTAAKSWDQIETVEGAFSVLADEAGKKCNDRMQTDINRISFCRIAATAAWQANEPTVVAYSKAGAGLCDKGDYYGSAPRDCAMLLVIPDLASADELADRYQKLIDPAAVPTPQDEDFIALYTAIKRRINRLVNSRASIVDKKGHPDLIQKLDSQIGTLFCKHLTWPAARINDTKTVQKITCEIYYLEKTLKGLGLSDQIRPCSVPGEPKRPEGCN